MFYRVAYDSDLFESLCAAVSQKQISAADRFGVVSDVFALSQARFVPTTVMLRVFASCKNEDEYMVLASVCASLSEVLSVFKNQPFFQQLQQFVRTLLGPVFRSLGWQPQEKEVLYLTECNH